MAVMFGLSAGDFIAAAKLIGSIRESFRDSSNAFDGLKREVESLHDALFELQQEVLRDELRSSRAGEKILRRSWYSRTWVVQELCDRGYFQFKHGKPDCADKESLAEKTLELWSNVLSLEEELENLRTDLESFSCNLYSSCQKVYACVIADCKVAPFARLRDLESHIRTIHMADREGLECSWPNLLQRIKINMDRCKVALCSQNSEKISIKQSRIETGSQLIIARTYLFWTCCNCGHGRCRSCRLMKRNFHLLALGSLVSALLMSASFLWLDQVAALEKPSNVVKTIVSAVTSVIPPQAGASSRYIHRSSILTAYLLSCALYSASTIAWFVLRLERASINYWYLFGLVATIFWALLGVTPAELFLTFLPLSVSIGICIYTISGEYVVNLTGCKNSVKSPGQYRVGPALLPVRSLEYCPWKQTMGQNQQDLERNLKG